MVKEARAAALEATKPVGEAFEKVVPLLVQIQSERVAEAESALELIRASYITPEEVE